MVKTEEFSPDDFGDLRVTSVHDGWFPGEVIWLRFETHQAAIGSKKRVDVSTYSVNMPVRRKVLMKLLRQLEEHQMITVREGVLEE